jgi:hypothetical protein
MEITEKSIDERIFETRLRLGWMEEMLDLSMDPQEVEAKVDEIMAGRIRLAILEVGAKLLREEPPVRRALKRRRAQRNR